MSRLGPEERALVDAARDAYAPTADDRERVKQALAGELGPEAFGVRVPAPSPARPWWHLAAGAVAVGLAVAGGLVLHGTRAPGPKPPTATVAPQATHALPQPAPVQPPGEILDPPAVPVESLRTVPATHDTAKSAPAVESTLERELVLLRRAKAAVDRGDADEALALLDRHEKTYPNGILAEERGATRVLALCSAGRTREAKTSASDFLAKYPHSPSAVRVRGSCAF